MNPFDLPGPPFLLFYLIFGTLVVIAMRMVNRIYERSLALSTRIPLDDPYAIAMLRGGSLEVARVATFSLVDRGLLKAEKGDRVISLPDADAYVRREIERTIIMTFCKAAPAITVFKAAGVLAKDCAEFEKPLQEANLLPSRAVKRRRLVTFLSALLLIEGTAGYKIHVALDRGHHNIAFLVFLGFFMFIALHAGLRKHRTGHGDVVLRQVRAHFQSLKDRASRLKPGGATNEVVFLAAIWGLAALPFSGFPYVARLFPKATVTTSTTSAGGCGGGGCGSGGGGGCGGGGCGGGCGGCG